MCCPKKASEAYQLTGAGVCRAGGVYLAKWPFEPMLAGEVPGNMGRFFAFPCTGKSSSSRFELTEPKPAARVILSK